MSLVKVKKKKKVPTPHTSTDFQTIYSSGTDEEVNYNDWSPNVTSNVATCQRPGGDQCLKVSKIRSLTKLGSCGSCEILVVKKDKHLTCNGCSAVFHLVCSNFNKQVYSAIETNNCFNDIIWRCDKCKVKARQRQTDTQEDSAPLIQSLLEMITTLQQRVAKLEVGDQKSQPAKSLAQKVPSKPNINRVTHQVKIPPEDNTKFTVQSFAARVKSNLHCVPVKNLKVDRHGRGIITFPDHTTREEGLSKLSVDFNAESNNRPQRMLLPSLTISDIPTCDYKSTDTAKLVQSISDKNPKIKELTEEGKVLKVIFIKEDVKRPGFSNAVVRVDPEIYHAIRSSSYRLYIDFNRCRVN